MSEHEEGAERTEQPTEKRLREARERGDAPRSRELGNAAVIGGSLLALMALGGHLARGARDWLRGALALTGDVAAADLPGRFAKLLVDGVLLVAPLLAACLLLGFLAPVAMGGLRFAGKAIAPDLNRMNPATNLKRIWGKDAVAELLRSVLRVVLIGGIAGVGIAGALPRLLGLMQQPLAGAAADGVWLVLQVLAAAAVALALLAALDVPYQRWSHRRKLMMTKQELREELKESDGRPEVKARIRRLQHEMSQRRMMEDVPRADVVLVNPTHYAVALAYDGGAMRAPRVVAKGADLVAHAIRELGERHGVPIVSAPPLARALYRQARIGEEIPVALYAAVAQVLGYVYQLRAWRRDGGHAPDLPDLPSQVPGGEPDPDAGSAR